MSGLTGWYSCTESQTGIVVVSSNFVAVDAVLFVVHLGPFSAIASHTGSIVDVAFVDLVVVVIFIFIIYYFLFWLMLLFLSSFMNP